MSEYESGNLTLKSPSPIRTYGADIRWKPHIIENMQWN